jgi:heme A synthase
MGVRVYRLLAAFSLLIVAGLAIAFWHRPPLSERQRDGVALLAVTAVTVLLQYLGYNLEFVQHQGRYLFPALVPLALLCAAGMWGWAVALESIWPAGRRALRWLPAALTPALAALALYALFGVVMPAFVLADMF